MKNHQAVLIDLGLPRDLVEMIRDGRLHDELRRAYARLQELNRRLDVWERQNPEAAVKMPWAAARQAWKDAGRPMPEWYEVLEHIDKDRFNEDKRSAFRNLINWPNVWSDPKVREKMRKASRKHQRKKHNYDPATFGRTVKRELKAAGYVDAEFLAC